MWCGEKLTGADIAKRFPPPQALQFQMAKEPGAIILRGHPYLRRGKFRMGLPEGSAFTQNLAAIAYGAHSSLNLFLEESPEILSQPLNLTDVWKPGRLDWQGTGRGNNLSKFTQLLMAGLGSEPAS